MYDDHESPQDETILKERNRKNKYTEQSLQNNKKWNYIINSDVQFHLDINKYLLLF